MSQVYNERYIVTILKQYYKIQKIRIALQNRLKIKKLVKCHKCGMTFPYPTRKKNWGHTCIFCGSKDIEIYDVKHPEILKEVIEDLLKVEKKHKKILLEVVIGNLLWEKYLQYIKGIGPIVSSYLVSVLNPAKFMTVSKLWKYTGMHVVDGKAPKRVKGKKIDWNPFARTMCWKIGESFRMVGGFYKNIYHQFYEESLRKHPKWTKLHVINDARRRTVKLFLAHYYEVGRTLLELPVYKPYPVAKEPHRYIPPVLDKPYDERELRHINLILKRNNISLWEYENYRKGMIYKKVEVRM